MLENLGEMELIVTNQTTGEQWRTVNNWVLQTSTANGVYLVKSLPKMVPLIGVHIPYEWRRLKFYYKNKMTYV